jgi:hypothetical protein
MRIVSNPPVGWQSLVIRQILPDSSSPMSLLNAKNSKESEGVYLTRHVLPPLALQTSDSQLFLEPERAAGARVSTRSTAKEKQIRLSRMQGKTGQMRRGLSDVQAVPASRSFLFVSPAANTVAS